MQEILYSSLRALSLTICFMVLPVTHAANFKVLVVMSYEQENPWCKEIKTGIESVLADTSEITYFYMNTKVDLEGGENRAREAYALYQRIKPDGVITADDNAQRMFVLPYLSENIKTPVMFCGVNVEPEQYGYPTAHVSGILERGHIRESLAFTKQLDPSISTVAFLTKASPSGRALFKQVERESDTYLTKTTFILVKSTEDIVSTAKQHLAESDAIYVDSLQGVLGPDGNPISNKEAFEILTSTFDKPIIGANRYHVEQGALCAVVKTGQEQGRTAARMLQKAMQGTPVVELPITRNFRGERVINVEVMKRLKIKPRPVVLLGAKLVKSQ